jgi:hypothetical protein
MEEWEIMVEQNQNQRKRKQNHDQKKFKETSADLRHLLVTLKENLNLLGVLLSSLFIMGCSTFTKPSITDVVQQNVSATAANVTFEKIQGFNNLSILSVIGGFCLLAGMILLVLTRGSMGWRGVIGGVSMIVVNYLIALYATWIFIPVVVITGAISLAWGWRIIVKIINDDDIKVKEMVSV